MDTATTTGAVIVAVLFTLVYTNKNTDIVIWAGVLALTLIPHSNDTGKFEIGIISFSDAFDGLTNEGVVAIAALFVVAAGVKETGLMGALLENTLKKIKSDTEVRFKILGTTSFVSAFFNNTPLMALLVPAISQPTSRYGLSPNRILMPLSFAAILGGACTLIGTNTNLIINGWLIENSNHVGFGIFEVTPIMLPGAITAFAILLFLSPKILPERTPVLRQLGDMGENTVEMIVKDDSPIVGSTIGDAGLRGLEGLYLIEIVRRNQSLAAVSSNILIEAGDRLCFVGAIDTQSTLETIEGLVVPEKRNFQLRETANRHFIEVVINGSNLVIGKSVKESRFRTIYSAAILAVARDGRHIKGKIGDIVLKEGDTLLLETRRDFLSDPEKQEDFFVVSNSKPLANKPKPSVFLPLSIVLLMVGIVTLKVASLMAAAIAAAIAMIITRCCTIENARKAIDWQILFTIAGTLALGKAMAGSGLASFIGNSLLNVLPANTTVYLVVFFILSSLVSNIISSKAGALFVLPIAASISQILEIPLVPLVLTIMVGASMAVASPLTYPTNLMVYGPGGYFFSDYLKLGLPVTAVTGFMGVVTIRLLFPF